MELLPLALAVLTTVQLSVAVSESIKGTRQTCDVEGEEFTVDKIPNSKCFACICKNGFVECPQPECPIVEGCYMLLEARDDDCCRRCKGCVHNGIHHSSGTEWKDPNDPCKILTCRAGVVTESKLRCHTQCPNPMPPAPGQCCPICTGCLVNGQKVPPGRAVTTTEDPCLTCRCEKGRLNCAKQACPVLHCPPSRMYTEPGNCCPQCRGKRGFLEPPRGACMLGTRVYPSGTPISPDHCTRCSCMNGTVMCTKETCPVLDCAPEQQKTQQGRCCPQCPIFEDFHSSCSYGGRTYEDGETWKLDVCKSCVCMQGKVRCAMHMCPSLTIPCPPNSKLEHPKDQCCPRCVESDGVCTVFGDPHYRTFDGKFFSFQGTCKYQLTADCTNHTFSIRVTNDGRSTRSSAWTKAIAIKVADLKVNLGQKMRVKVNGKRIEVPYRLDNRLDINRTSDSVLVTTHIGIKVLWDGISFIEVSAPTTYRGRLCGLCGNFNHVPKDDFTTRRGKLLQDANQFGKSWMVGSKKLCARTRQNYPFTERRCRGRKDHRFCNRLRSEVFYQCHKKVNPTMYYKSCLTDMCECPTGRCYCESFTAYAHECQRLGVQLPHWRGPMKCPNAWTTAGLNARGREIAQRNLHHSRRQSLTMLH
ncbi:BMP-binding endothelial regulator protein isoform X1 [Neodiprion pinetum]|uniref:BMP-binding endothelial regulator protein isoform X1 n=1 Tax=Neodiprion pinetum TaxID=441929 RepID=UPI001EDDF3D8|nr:BMP-binding endothelial regulator protein isoform X1 [Neodiprion pinetum]XP_046485973.1 BMP-binding endothelial regulator protein isoform X1 [Neodiprion pinetum]XP_046485974.1 BMP-binding endothelial regulator protein isoform X1 [Neodiprion pinetum]